MELFGQDYSKSEQGLATLPDIVCLIVKEIPQLLYHGYKLQELVKKVTDDNRIVIPVKKRKEKNEFSVYFLIPRYQRARVTFTHEFVQTPDHVLWFTYDSFLIQNCILSVMYQYFDSTVPDYFYSFKWGKYIEDMFKLIILVLSLSKIFSIR